MEIESLEWAGFFFSFLAAFLFSLFHMSLGSFSKISLSRFLEDEEKQYRLKILEIYDEIKIAVEFMRILFIIAFLIYLYVIFPRLMFWPLWLFLISLAIYFIFFDLIPRLLNSLSRKKILGFFLPSYRLAYFIASPLLLIKKIKPSDEEKDEIRETSDEEIQAFIDEAKEEGIIEKEEGVLLRSVVEFGDIVVREIMTPRVDIACIPKDSTIHKLRDLVIQVKHSRIPVYKDKIDNIEGIVIAKDLLEYADDKLKNYPIEPLIRPVYFVPESMKVAELLKEFQRRKQKLAVVVDEHGGVSGLVTMEDLVEEIVGEIRDEYDMDQARIVEKGPFDYVVSGDAEVEEIEELFDLEFAEEDYLTAGGLITHHLGRLPEKGEQLQIKGLSLEVLEVDQKRIKKLRIKKQPN
ncbi:MAG: CBS domain-containing protein [Candidatus Aminicenantes bacterium]|nr:CBS domain-containing protein [Candidatus Aminicenantes bacterium]